MISMNKDELRHCAEEIIAILGRNDDITRGVQKALWEQVDNMAHILDKISDEMPPWED